MSNFFSKSVEKPSVSEPNNKLEQFSDVATQRQKCIHWIQYNNAWGLEAGLIADVVKNLDKAISMPTHHFEWRIGASLTRTGKPYILKWIDGAFQVIEVDDETWTKLEVGERSITFVEIEKQQQNNLTSALTVDQRVLLKQLHIPPPSDRLNGYRPIYGFIEMQSKVPLDENNIVLSMEHEIYYAGRRTVVANYFYPNAIKSNSLGETILDFKFPSLNCNERSLQGLFTLHFKLFDKVDSKKSDDWILMSNILAYSVEVV